MNGKIEEHISDHLSADGLASSVFFSKFHYQRLFRELMGDSLMAYVKKRRLSLAGKDLLETKDTVLEIALRWGYSNHGSFTRAFKAYMGVTPADYRKYKLSAISKKAFEKECAIMSNRTFIDGTQQYTNTSEEVIRELNSMIAEIKDSSAFALKNAVQPYYVPFFQRVKSKCEEIAGQLQAGINMFNNSGGFLEISNRLAIVKIAEDSAFYTNILSFNVALYTARATKEHNEKMQPICENFTQLAKSFADHTGKITDTCRDVAVMLQEDMKNTAIKQAKDSIQVARDLVAGVKGYSYLKDEINAIAQELSSMPYEKLTSDALDDLIYRADIIAFTAGVDSVRNPSDTQMLDTLKSFTDSLAETKDFIKDIESARISSDRPLFTRSDDKYFKDIAFQGNILYFYLKGEREKLGTLLTPDKNEVFQAILNEVNGFIHTCLENLKSCNTLGFNCKNAMADLAEKILRIETKLKCESEALGDKGSAILFFANQFGNLANSIKRACNE